MLLFPDPDVNVSWRKSNKIGPGMPIKHKLTPRALKKEMLGVGETGLSLKQFAKTCCS